jgi:cytochrome c-type biogenesis protein CcmH
MSPEGLSPEESAFSSTTSPNQTSRRNPIRLIAPLLLLAALSVLPLIAQQPSAQQPSDRVKAIGGKFQCMCGCGQVLTQCNHVGCTTSTAMLKQLTGWVNRGDSEETITQSLVQQFGTTVYAEPPKSGFSLIAWSMPAVYFIVGAVLVIFVIRKWRARPATALAGGPSLGAHSQDAFNRARAQADRETED